ncbi:MAG TPA: efflux RND transporter periplasmic adaptor subunit [Puia sp.]|jgi:membrane fusion protein (multidrug efflux system)|nr:efflux RND transporter periplasmic adaptor subunit [Puia sp.]
MRKLLVLSIILAAATIYSFSSCNQAKGTQAAPPPQSLPVFPIAASAATTYLEYTATLEGKTNVEIRPQVSGYLDKIYVEEGSFVRAGQPLFKINDRPYDAQLRNTEADVEAARANMEKAAIEVHRLQPLVANHVISDVQLRSAQAAYDQAKAQVSQAEAAGKNAGINLGYTLLKAPVDGFIGRIPFKVGALVGKGETQALTVLSDVKEVYAYFSMSENDFLVWSEQATGKTVQEKIQSMPPVELQLADNSIYGPKGHVQLMEGQFDKTMGTVSFRAIFPNTDGLLRTGSTGKVRIPQASSGVMPVPQQATYELQDKVFVFVVGDSNKVSSQPLHIVGKTTGWWLVDKGVKPGDRIVFAGMDRLQDGAVINPQPLKADSIYHVMPL